MKEIKKVSIIGKGALGVLYADMISRSLGNESIAFVMDGARYEKHCGEICTVNGTEMHFETVQADKAEPCDLVIVAVKYPALENALDTMKKCVGKDTLIISLLNGISSEGIIGERFGADNVIPTVAQGMDAMYFGTALTYSKPGKLFIGAADDTQTEKVEIIRRFFENAGIPHTVEDDIMYRMWSKFMLNVGINQTCMVYGTGYGGAMTAGSPEYMTLVSAMREVVLLANSEGIKLGEAEVAQYLGLLETLDPNAMPSMAQDRVSRRKSEVELFAGTVIPMARKYGIPVPANEFLMKRVREIEAEY